MQLKHKQMKLQNKCYRIITDKFRGYEVQERKKILFLSYWKQSRCYGSINTFPSIREAQSWIEEGCPSYNIPKRKTVWVSEKCKQ